jgi:hypothetical protein
MARAPQEMSPDLHIDPLLARHWVRASRSLAQLHGQLKASALTDIWEPLLSFVEALDATRARGLALDVATLARDDVLRKSARCAESEDALQTMAAQAKMQSLSGIPVLTPADLVAVQSLLLTKSKGVTATAPSADLERWLHDWHSVAQPDAQPDVLLQWPTLHARWSALQPTQASHWRLGCLLDRLLLQRAGLLPSMSILWSRALIASGLGWTGRSVDPVRSSAPSSLTQTENLLDVLNLAALQTGDMLSALSCLWSEVSHAVQAQHKFYSPELIRHLFLHPASRVDLLARDMAVTRLTATRYLDALVDTGTLQRERFGRDNIYAHGALQAVIRPPDMPLRN